MSSVECLGACVNAPMMQINDNYYVRTVSFFSPYHAVITYRLFVALISSPRVIRKLTWLRTGEREGRCLKC